MSLKSLYNFGLFADKHTDEDQIAHNHLGGGNNHFTSERLIEMNTVLITFDVYYKGYVKVL